MCFQEDHRSQFLTYLTWMPLLLRMPLQVINDQYYRAIKVKTQSQGTFVGPFRMRSPAGRDQAEQGIFDPPESSTPDWNAWMGDGFTRDSRISGVSSAVLQPYCGGGDHSLSQFPNHAHNLPPVIQHNCTLLLGFQTPESVCVARVTGRSCWHPTAELLLEDGLLLRTLKGTVTLNIFLLNYGLKLRI